MWGKIIIPMYRLWLNGLYGLYGPRCPLFSKRPINLISLSLSCDYIVPIIICLLVLKHFSVDFLLPGDGYGSEIVGELCFCSGTELILLLGLLNPEMCSERDSPLKRLYWRTHAKLTRLAGSGQLVWAADCELSLALVHARRPAWPGETSETILRVAPPRKTRTPDHTRVNWPVDASASGSAQVGPGGRHRWATRVQVGQEPARQKAREGYPSHYTSLLNPRVGDSLLPVHNHMLCFSWCFSVLCCFDDYSPVALCIVIDWIGIIVDSRLVWWNMALQADWYTFHHIVFFDNLLLLLWVRFAVTCIVLSCVFFLPLRSQCHLGLYYF